MENNGYISQPQVKMLTEKVWKTRLDAIQTATGKLSEERKAATAMTLENTKKNLAYLESIGATQSPDIGAYKRFALDMVGSVVPNLIAYDIASVQAIDNRIAMVNFIKYNYGTTKGATKAGTTFADIRNLYKSDVDYTSDHVEGEEILAGDTEGTSKSFTLDWAPLLPGKVEFTLKIDATDYQFKDDGNGAITAVTAGAPFTSGKVNYGTGAVELTLNAAKTVTAGTASYGYANEYVPAQSLPSITLSIESLPIKAKTRRLAALWGFEASYELQKEYGQSMEELLSTTASGEIAHEIDMEIMGDIYNSAVASGITFSTTAPQAISLQDHYDSFLIKLNQAANKIYQNTRRIRPNYVICGTGAATIIESIRIFKASGETSAKGPFYLAA